MQYHIYTREKGQFNMTKVAEFSHTVSAVQYCEMLRFCMDYGNVILYDSANELEIPVDYSSQSLTSVLRVISTE